MFREPILWLKRLILLSIGGLLVYWGYYTFAQQHYGAAAIASIFVMWGAGYFAGQIFGRVGGQIAGEKFADVLFYHREFLSRRPVLISHAQGLIQQHQYAEAEKELQAIIAAHPGHQAAVMALGQLYLDKLGDYAAAEKVADIYLCRRLKIARGDLGPVNLYVDASLAQGKTAEALARLEYELTRQGYADTERHALAARCDALR